MRNNSKTKHVEKLIIISRNKNSNYNSNDNDLKDKQNHRFKRKEILISTRSWSGLCAFLNISTTQKSVQNNGWEKK